MKYGTLLYSLAADEFEIDRLRDIRAAEGVTEAEDE